MTAHAFDSTCVIPHRRSASRALFVSPIKPLAKKVAAFTALVTTAMVANAQTCLPPTNQDWTAWLQRQEDAGGHTKACHLGVQVTGLIGRLEDRGGAKAPACTPLGNAASAWSDPASLLNAIKPAITKYAAGYAAGPAGNYVIADQANQPIGTTVTRFDGKDPSKNRSSCAKNSSYVCQSTNKWTAVVRKDATGACYLVTAYPN